MDVNRLIKVDTIREFFKIEEGEPLNEGTRALLEAMDEDVIKNNRFHIDEWLEEKYNTLMEKFTKNATKSITIYSIAVTAVQFLGNTLILMNLKNYPSL